ncbi:MAG TPA: serine/threonine-protein kinase, partial [Tepidisphaeraceae bacterium]|nr:serine/threonine-protein kinase [Tepidisphaeraceae bacterium]
AGLLGRGGMGEVYRATDLALGQAVALKFLPETTASDERALARFYNEVRVARQVTHPNVCRVYDVGVAEGLHYISMEFVDGEDLGQLLRRIGRLPADKAVETARKLCMGLGAAHEKGVLHRDLKPANVMIDGRGQIVIMDFGLAGIAEQLQGDIRSGTPAYMSPEQLAGTEVTVKSDIYALGLLLYELFTGKRAFEAASLMELMQMQERAAPASITTIVRDLDPAAERIIMRCLSHDPAQRPASAIAVAAALPGGDPLAAAIAAGETPSPELVAMAGETDGLMPKVAVSCLAAALVMILANMVISPRVSITSKINLENSPDALSRDARRHIQSFGYTAKPGDAGWGLDYPSGYQSFVAKHPKEAAERWKNPGVGYPPLVQFWYRESPLPMPPQHQFNVALQYDDPPLERSGMVRLQTDTDGKLLEFEAVPPEVEKPAPAVPPFDWGKLFQAAALDMTQFEQADAQWTPLANWDQRAAWTGTDASTGVSLRIEAAAWRGRPVFFKIIGPWTAASRMAPLANSTGNSTPVLVIIYTVLIAACVLGWVNVRRGRADMRGATWLAGIFVVSQAAGYLIGMHHTTSVNEFTAFWTAIGMAMVNGGLNWVVYVALEPWVRRKWPRTMIGWTRFTSRGAGDPLVGRDLLYGSLLGAPLALGDAIVVALHGNNGMPAFPPLDALLGVKAEMSAVLRSVAAAMFTALLFFFMLFLLRLLLRKDWIAGVAFVAVMTFATTPGSTTPLVDYPLNALAYAIFAFMLLRFGLLAAMITSLIGQLLALGRMLDFSAWYAGMALMPFVLVVVVTIYGFRKSLAGRKLFAEI